MPGLKPDTPTAETRIGGWVWRSAALLTACALILLLVAGCGSSHASGGAVDAARPSLETIFEAGLPGHGDPSPTLDVLRRLGVARVKLFLNWNALAPQPTTGTAPGGFRAQDPAAYPASAWAPFDTVMRDAQARGLSIDLTIGGPPPRWAAGAGAPSGGPYPQWKPSPQAFAAFVRAVGTRYSGSYTPAGSSAPLPRVSFWAIWNEPNYGPYLAPQAIDSSTVEVSPRLYRGLLDAAWSALSATGHAGDTILIGELAPRGQTVGDSPGNFSGMVPLRFVRALYCLDAQLKPLQGQAALLRGCPSTPASSRSFQAQHPVLFGASGLSVHPYPQGRVPPNLVTSFEPDYADLSTLPNLESLLDHAMAAYGSAKRFALYSTEFGYKTDPPYPAGAPAATAALYLNWSEYISWRDPRIRAYDQYLLGDPPPTGPSNFDSGLIYADGRPKPSFDAFRLPLFLPVTSAAKGHALEIWGCVRPAAYARRDSGRTQQGVLEFAGSAQGPFSVIGRVAITDPNGYFDIRMTLPSTGVLRLSWSYPHGPTVHSRLVSVTIG